MIFSIIKKQIWFNFLAAWLFLIAAWTILIKFIFPIIYSINYNESVFSFIMWDFWWIAHIWLGYSLLNISSYTFYGGVIISIFELFIILIKLYWFFLSPEWSIWNTNWMINKIMVLILFVFIIITLIINKDKFLKKL